MLSEDRYIDEVWNKYNNYISGKIQDDFYTQSVYRRKYENKFLKAVAMFIFSIIISVSAVYAGIAIYNYYKKHSSNVEYSLGVSKVWVIDNMKQADNMQAYYTEIDTFEEYLKFKEKFPSMEDIEEKDFEDNFVIFVCKQDNDKIKIGEIETNEDSLHIEFIPDAAQEVQKTFTILVPKEQHKNNIELEIVSNLKQSNFKQLTELPDNYTPEQAISDGCIVIKDEMLISNNKEKLYEFIEKSKNGEECFIRRVRYAKESKNKKYNFEASDVKYVNGVYLISGKKVIDEKVEYWNKDINYIKIELIEESGYEKCKLYNEIGDYLIYMVRKN